MTILMDAALIISGVNILLLGALLYPSVRNLQKTKSLIAAGLAIFVIIFLSESIMTIFFHITMMRYYTPDVEPLVFALNLLKMLSFGTLAWVTYR